MKRSDILQQTKYASIRFILDCIILWTYNCGDQSENGVPGSLPRTAPLLAKFGCRKRRAQPHVSRSPFLSNSLLKQVFSKASKACHAISLLYITCSSLLKVKVFLIHQLLIRSFSASRSLPINFNSSLI
jgi:hypothetical protein